MERFGPDDAGTLTAGSDRLGLILNGLKSGVRGARGTESPATIVMKQVSSLELSYLDEGYR